MTTIRLATNELRRLTAGRLPKLAVLALVLVPLLYGSLYLYANWDPYGRLGNTPAALVVADTGTTNPDGEKLHVGQDVATQLTKSNTFQWHQVSEQDAENGVQQGKYAFAVVLPADFSQALSSSANFTPRQGQLTLITNDANNYLVRTIADKIIAEVRDSVAATVGTQAANQLLLGFATIHDQVSAAAIGANQLASGAAEANTGAQRLASGSQALAQGQQQLLTGANRLAAGSTQAARGATQLAGGLNTLRDKTRDLPAQTAALASGARQVAAGDTHIAAIGNQLAGAAQEFVNDLATADSTIAARLATAGLNQQQINQVLGLFDRLGQPIAVVNQQIQSAATQLDVLANGATQVANGATQLATTSPQLANGIQQAASGANQLSTGANALGSGATQLRNGLAASAGGAYQLAAGADQLQIGTGQLSTGATQLHNGLSSGLSQIPDPDAQTRVATARTIGDPVAVREVGQVTAPNYGYGLAPFFLSLAIWIGAFVLFLLVRPLSKRALAAGVSALRIAIGGYLPAAALGVAQVVVLLLVVIFALGVHPAYPLAVFGFLTLAILANVAVVHALNALFGSVGKFLSLVLLILQLISAGGTFPWQTTPSVLYPLHLVLPMGYVVDGLRHLLYGGTLSSLLVDCLVLVGYLAAGLALSTLAAHRQKVWTVARLEPELAL